MRHIAWSVLALFIALPLCGQGGQGLTINLKETGPAGPTAPMMQADRTHARLDIPSLVSQVVYDSTTKTLQVLVPPFKIYREYTPATVQKQLADAAAAGRGQAPPAKVTYRRTGSSKVGTWTCTTYDGYRETGVIGKLEKVAEVCAAEGTAIALTAADFTVAQQAIDLAKGIAAPEILERIPVYGTVASQGFPGFPVRRVTFLNGHADITTELVGIVRAAVPAANFTVPADFKKAP